MDTNFNTNVAGALSLITVNGSTYQLGKDASASVGGIMKLYTTVGGENDTHTDGAVSQSALTSALSAINGGAALSVEKDGVASSNPTIGADGHTYAIKQGTTTLFSISVAKDMVVSDGEVITATGDEKTTTDGNTSADLTAGDKYIKLQLANSNKLLYIPVNSLYKDYSFSDTTEIDFTDTNNTITAAIKTGSIAKGKLDSSVQASLDLADSALQAHQDITGKADKVASATSGNFAGLDTNGNLTDSGYKASDFQAAGSYKTTQTAVTDPSAGSTPGLTFIASISQNTNGVITATKETVQSASASQAGLMSAAHYSKLAAIAASVSGDTLMITTQAA
jgi:hypothetical protein